MPESCPVASRFSRRMTQGGHSRQYVIVTVRSAGVQVGVTCSDQLTCSRREDEFLQPELRMTEMLRQRLLDTSRGRIVSALQHGPLTVEDIATKLSLTRSAVRVQIAGMEREGVVRRVGKRPGTTRPSHVYELTPEVEQLLSKAYLPLLTHLVGVFAEALPPQQLESLLRQTGKAMAGELLAGKRTAASLRVRAGRASELLNQHLGALTRVERNGEIIIRGAGCPLAALTGKHPGVCLAMESLVTEIVGVRVRECCDREGRPRCCFEIHSGRSPRSSTKNMTK